MRRWKKTFYRQFFGPASIRLEKGLVRLNDVLSDTPLHDKYWINGGLLLGWVRNGGPLPHDEDADFSFWEHDRQLLMDAMPVLRRHGFHLRRKRPNNDGSFTTFTFRHLGIDFDFCQMFLVNGRMRWIGRAGAVNLELINEVPNHGLEEIQLLGRRWLKPDDHETYLRSLYGDWRTPHPGYCSWRDSQAVIDRYPMKRTRR